MNTGSLYRSPAGESEMMALYDKVLAHWPVPNETLSIPTRYGNTFIIVCGEKSAPDLVLFHGSCSNAVSWIGEVKTYCRYFRTYAVDIPGEPGKSSPNRLPWNSSAYADWIDDLLVNLKLSRVSLAGISQGGWTALKFATCHPDKVDKLALLTPAGVTQNKTGFLLRAIFFSILGKKGAEMLNSYVFGKEPVHPEVMSFMNAIMTHFKPRIGSMAMFTDKELARLTMPVLLLGGARDSIRNVENISVRLRKYCPKLKTLIFPKKGHVLMNVAENVIPFLRSG
jgi:pimeloyl-ACP methyl ester carboxylesterase